MSIKKSNSARIALRTTPEIKTQIERAALLSPPHDVTSFMIEASLAATRKIHSECDSFGIDPEIDTFIEDIAQADLFIQDFFEYVRTKNIHTIICQAGSDFRILSEKEATTYPLDQKLLPFIGYRLWQQTLEPHRSTDELNDIKPKDKFIASIEGSSTGVFYLPNEHKTHDAYVLDMLRPPTSNKLMFTIWPRSVKNTKQIPKECMKKMKEQNADLTLIVGATGSGKTTLMNEMIHQMEFPIEQHSISIEETPELYFDDKEGITQIKIGYREDPTSILRSCMRAQPDQIFLGEIRSVEVAAMLEPMLSSNIHLVGTINSEPNPDKVFERLKNLGVPINKLQQFKILIATIKRDQQGRKYQLFVSDRYVLEQIY